MMHLVQQCGIVVDQRFLTFLARARVGHVDHGDQHPRVVDVAIV